MEQREQLHGSRELPHQKMWQSLDPDKILQEHTILSLFEEQVKEHPEKKVLLFRDQVLTYGQLDRCATALGQRLRAMGIGREDRVAILAQRSLEMVVAVYGVLKAGGAYVPIDAAYPPERISYILEDAAPKAILLYGGELRSSLPVVSLEDALQLLPEETTLPKGRPEDLAYLIYTSGTSGKPKGVMIENRNVVNYSLQQGEGVLRYLPRGSTDTIVSLTNFVFDIFVTELLMAPMLGMTVILADDREQVDAQALWERMSKHPGAIMQTTPSRVQLYLSQKKGEEALGTFSYMMLGGEAVSPQLVQRLHRINPQARIVDVYGPSETTVWSTCAEVTQGDVTIGTPITNTRVYILHGLEPCGVGVPGELCIGGQGVARGYLNRPDLTEEKFIPDPFGTGRIYRTGDLAQWREDGNLEFLGRIDDQVKIRGTRIELGEIDAVLREQPYVKDCAVIAREDGSGQKELFAYLVSEEALDLHRVRQELGAFLPESMIPAYFAQIDKIPLNPNGKLDKRALPAQVQRLSQTYAEPVTAHEQRLCRIFGEILGIDTVGIHDHFFQMGGHSFRTIRLRNRIEEEFGCELTQGEIFANPTPCTLGALLEHRTRQERDVVRAHPELTYLPASPSQRGVFYATRLRDGEDDTYHLPGVYALHKELSVERFREAFCKVIRRHEILRTVFVLDKGIPYQRILPYSEPDLTVTEDRDTDSETLIRSWMRPFDTEKGPLIRGRLVLGREEPLLLLDIHHMICDGLGRELLLSELMALYEGRDLPEPEYQFKDHCIWLSQQELHQQRAYWMEQYKQLPLRRELPAEYARSLSHRGCGAMLTLPLGEALSRDIRALAKDRGASAYMVFLSAAFILLGRHYGSEDVVIGSAFSGRTNRVSEQMPGMFVNTLPLRGYPGGDKSYRAFLEEVKELTFRGQENQDYGLEALVRDLQLLGEPGRNPLFDVMLVMQNGEKAEYGTGTLGLRPVREFYFGATFDLTFNIEEEEGSYILSLQYAGDLFAEGTAELYLRHFGALLQDLVRHPHADIGELSMISPYEEEQLRAFRGTVAPYDAEAAVSQLFEEQVRKDPHAIAIVCEEQSLTYGELNGRANAIAYRLRQEGVGPEVPVALLLPQSLERFVAIYAVLKAGGFYVPIDPDYPEDRIAYILADSGARLLLTTAEDSRWRIPTVNLRQESLYTGDFSDLPQEAGPHTTAYCIYTSGTTGSPKGVLVEHEGVSNLNAYFRHTLGITPRDRILQFANYVFDGSVWEMNMALLNGARLILVTDPMDGDRICRTMEEEGVTVASFPPNFYGQLRQVSPRILVTAGSASHRAIAERPGPLRYVNSYGPTECTVAVTHWEGKSDYSFVPIGKPIANKQVYILRGDRPCALGVPGEICVGGVGLARGYLGREELTRQQFIPNPFGEGLLYRTGDMGLMMADGNLRFLGRADDQVKIRGYRVEPGEVEIALRELPYILDCALVVGQDPTGDRALFAYVVTGDHSSFDRIRSDLRKTLPDYMIPTYLMELEQIPVTANGKVDKDSLPPITLCSDREYIPPRDSKEKLLAEAMEDILGVKNMSVKDGFFEMGGDSIKAIRIVAYLRERNMGLTVRDIMENNTVEEMASYMQDLCCNTYDQGEILGHVKDTPVIRMFRHWALSQPGRFLQSTLFPMDTDEEALRYGLNAVVKHHDILRAVYRQSSLMILPYREDSHFDLSSYRISSETDVNARIEEVCTRACRTMDPEKGPMIKVCLLETSEQTLVMMAVHHLLIDSVSWHILLADLERAVDAYTRGAPAQLPLKTASYQQWAAALEDYSRSPELEAEREYWQEVVHRLPYAGLQKSECRGTAQRSDSVSLTPLQTEQLLTQACNTYHTQINDLLLGALTLAMGEYTGQGTLAVCLEGHGREPIHIPMDIDRTIGWFTCAYPVLLTLTESVRDAVIETKELLRRVPNRGIGFGLLYPPEALDDITVYFNYVGQTEETAWDTEEDIAVGGPVNLNGGIYEGALTFRLSAGRGWEPCYDLSTIGELYYRALLRILDHCLSSEESYRTYADVDAEDLSEEDFDEISALLGLT